MPITDMKLHRHDGTTMPTDEYGKLTEVEDLRTVLHEMVQDMAHLLSQPIPMVGMSMGDMLLLSNPVKAVMLQEALTIVHGATCPHLDSNGNPMPGAMEAEAVDMPEQLMQQLLDILNKQGGDDWQSVRDNHPTNEYEGE